MIGKPFTYFCNMSSRTAFVIIETFPEFLRDAHFRTGEPKLTLSVLDLQKVFPVLPLRVGGVNPRFFRTYPEAAS